jgi:thiol-disulfide isomerase/thioredoxin
MPRACRSLIGGLFGLALVLGTMAHGQGPTPAPEHAPAAVELKDVTYAELGAVIRGLRGRIVVVDFWADYCVPCKHAFPHLVDMQRTYGAQGVICLSVSVDEPQQREAALTFLKTQKATFPNFRLNEPVAVWQERLAIKGPPAVFVFDRDGSRVGKFDSSDPNKSFTHTNVEVLVKDLLETRP